MKGPGPWSKRAVLSPGPECCRGHSVFSPLTSEAPGTGSQSQPICQEWVPAVQTWWLLQHRAASTFYPSAPYKNDHFLCVQGYERDWAVLGQVTFTVSSHTHTEIYDCTELMRSLRRGERGPGESLRVTDQGKMKILSPRGERSTYRQRFKKWECQGREGSLYLLTQVRHLKPQDLKSTARGSAWSHAALGEAAPCSLLGQQTSRKPDSCGNRRWGLAQWKSSESLSSRCSQCISCQQWTLPLKLHSGAKEVISQVCLVQTWLINRTHYAEPARKAVLKGWGWGWRLSQHTGHLS